MKLPVDLDALPEELARHVREAQDEGLWGDAIEAFEAWLDEAGKRPAPVLIMLAFMLYRDALEVMVDQVDELGTRAIALLDEAKQPKQTAALRREIERAVGRDRERSKQTSEKVAKSRAKPLESLSLAELRELAYKLGESKKSEELAIGARAWLLVSEQEEDAFGQRDAFGRAALIFAEAKDWKEALPRLEKILKKPADYEDWIAGYAWHHMLDKAIEDGDVALFEKRWKAALAMKREDHFPFSHPVQARYLEYAIEQKLTGVAKHLVAIIEAHRSARDQKALKPLLDRARALR
ncbi:MAG: hypothetical protein M4D80_22120 [Myxococcota bacterium]|nr:hypothetical protein [Deltaproteobacteria bacterium]MDQ3337867.1 hypothetical protein [Myxococcota bacterium]